MKLWIAIFFVVLRASAQPFTLNDVTQTARSSTLLTGLKAYWRFETPWNIGLDSTSFANNLATNGGTVLQWGGLVGNACGFNSALSQYLSIPNNANLEVGNFDFSGCASFRMGSLPAPATSAPILAKWNTTGNGRQFALVYDRASFTPSNDVAFCVSSNGMFGANNFVVSGLGPLLPTNWYTVVFGYDKTNGQLWISLTNGVKATKSYSLGVAVTGADLQVGRSGSTTYFQGLLDNIGFWNRTLTTGECAQIQSQGFATQFPRFAKSTTDTSIGVNWGSAQLLVSGGRNDSIESLGDGVVLSGSRSPTFGHIYRSSNWGTNWTDLGALIGTNEVSCIRGAGSGVVYLTTGFGQVWKSTDSGQTWGYVATASTNPAGHAGFLTYSIIVTGTGALLVCDSNVGGHVFRSTDGATNWTDIGQISTDSLYRFQQVGDGVLVLGWSGHVYKSTNDGQSWTDKGLVVASPLFATEYLGNGICLLGSEGGNIYRSVDNGDTWGDVKTVTDGCDDMAYLGNGIVTLCTYTGNLYIWRSYDYGVTWANCYIANSPAAGDNIDHMIGTYANGVPVGLASSVKGYFLRTP